MFAILTSRISMKYWFKNVADNIYIYPKSAPRNLILQTRTSDCNSATLNINDIPQHKSVTNTNIVLSSPYI